MSCGLDKEAANLPKLHPQSTTGLHTSKMQLARYSAFWGMIMTTLNNDKLEVAHEMIIMMTRTTTRIHTTVMKMTMMFVMVIVTMVMVM